MSIRPRKSELQAIEICLEMQHGSLEDAARAAWKTAADQFLQRDWFVVVVHDPGVCVSAQGLFPGKPAAQRAIEKGAIFAASAGATGLILQVVDPALALQGDGNDYQNASSDACPECGYRAADQHGGPTPGTIF